jgi:hypothetical protein
VEQRQVDENNGPLGSDGANVYLMLEEYFYVGQGYSGERCGPWASCFMNNIIKKKRDNRI